MWPLIMTVLRRMSISEYACLSQSTTSDFKVKKVQRADTSMSQFSPCHYTTTTVPLKQRLTTKKPSILSRETLQMSNITQYVTHGTNIEN